MKTIILFIGVLIITFASGQLLNQQCNTDPDCGGNNWVCSSEKKCRCGVGYRTGNQQNCVFIIGSTCEADDECENLPGSTCENNKCICKAGLEPGSKSCVPLGKEGDECTDHSQCIQRTGVPDNDKECKDKMCVCKAGTHEGIDKRCKRSIGFDEECGTAEDDCFQADSHNNNALECVEVDQTKKCKCKQGYTEKDGQCNGSATIFILSVSSLLLVVMAVLKM